MNVRVREKQQYQPHVGGLGAQGTGRGIPTARPVAHQGAIPLCSQCSTKAKARRANVISEDASRERGRTREELLYLLQAPRLHSRKVRAPGEAAEQGVRQAVDGRVCCNRAKPREPTKTLWGGRSAG